VKTKWNLTKPEQRAHSENAERLKSAGVTIGLENTPTSPLVKIEQCDYGILLAGAHKGIGLAAGVSLIALKSGITICDYEITIPGYDGEKILLVPIPEGSRSYKALNSLEFEKDVVLNHLILNGRPLPCARMFEGFLVAQSLGSLPDQFQTRGLLDAKICLFDQFVNAYSCEVEFMFERAAQAKEHARKRDSIFAPKQVLGTPQQSQVHVPSASAVSKTVSDVEENAGD
jgi:hypothetical protein